VFLMPKKTKPAARRTTSTGSRTVAPLELPKPKLNGGKSLLVSLRQRQTIREVSDRKLPLQLLSNLLWAACGVNRREGPFGGLGVTAASASNSQEIDVFVALERGVFLFDAGHHTLLPVFEGGTGSPRPTRRARAPEGVHVPHVMWDPASSRAATLETSSILVPGGTAG